VTRILDVDLDFFVHGVEHFVDLDDLTRLDDGEYEAWSLDEASAFLTDQCGVAEPLPGWAIERHGEAFDVWRRALTEGSIKSPLSITHVDAHADLGLGEPVHVEIMSELMFLPVEVRAAQASRVTDGSYLAFACAAGWISDLTYVFNDEGGEDLHPYHMKDWDPRAPALQFKAVQREDLLSLVGKPPEERPVARVDSEIPFRHMNWREFRAEVPFDAIVICRSPNFTPPSADRIYEMVRDRYLR
jgi:hypothetical protein